MDADRREFFLMLVALAAGPMIACVLLSGSGDAGDVELVQSSGSLSGSRGTDR